MIHISNFDGSWYSAAVNPIPIGTKKQSNVNNRVISPNNLPGLIGKKHISSSTFARSLTVIVTNRAASEKNQIIAWMHRQLGPYTTCRITPRNIHSLRHWSVYNIYLIFRDDWIDEIRNKLRVKNVSNAMYKTHIAMRLIEVTGDYHISAYDSDLSVAYAYYKLAELKNLTAKIGKSNDRSDTTEITGPPRAKMKIKVVKERKKLKPYLLTFNSDPNKWTFTEDTGRTFYFDSMGSSGATITFS